MFCENCGCDMPDNSKACPVCGKTVPGYEVSFADIQRMNQERDRRLQRYNGQQNQKQMQDQKRMQDQMQNQRQDQMQNQSQKRKREKKPLGKGAKIAIIASSVLVVAAAVTIVLLLTFMGRGRDRAFDMYAKFADNGDYDKLYKVMYPGDFQDEAEKLTKSGEIFDLVSWNKDNVNRVRGDKFTLKDDQDVDSYDGDLRKDVEEHIFKPLGIEYTDLQIVDVTGQDGDSGVNKDGTLSNILIYKVDNNWYVLPGCLELVTTFRQNTDIASAADIKEAVKAGIDAMSWEDITVYEGVVIPFEDVKYMPAAFADEVSSNLSDVPEIKHKNDGAVGYAFSIDADHNAHIYISSDTYMDEWDVTDGISDQYRSGERHSEDDSAMHKRGTYSYARLISDSSPLLGYWQADSAGMYIGYNITGGGEGFTVICDFQETYDDYSDMITYRIINMKDNFSGNKVDYQDWTCTGGEDFLEMENSSDDTLISHLRLTINVAGDSSIRVDKNGSSYEFTRTEITDDIRNIYAGSWVYDSIHDQGDIGEENDISLCSECGYLSNSGQLQHLCGADDNVVEIYNGASLLYVRLNQGLWDETTSYWLGVDYGILAFVDAYTIMEDGRLNRFYGDLFQSENFTYVKADSDEAESLLAVAAYKDELAMHDYGSGKFYMKDIDGDGIPECICYYDGYRLAVLLTYKNGQVYVNDCLHTYAIYISNSENGLLIEGGASAGMGYWNEYKITDGGFETVSELDSEEGYNVDGIEDSWRIDGQNVNEDRYDDRVSELLDKYPVYIDPDCPSVESAYTEYRENR